MNVEYLKCAAGIYTCFLLWQLAQEKIVTGAASGQRRFEYFIFLNLCQSVTATAVGLSYFLYTSKNRVDKNLTTRNPLRILLEPRVSIWLFVCSLLSSISPLLGYHSMKHLDYPSIIIGKSCKLIPVMLIKVILFRKKFTKAKYIVTFLVTSGLYIFAAANMEGGAAARVSRSINTRLKGILLLTGNLTMDGLTNSIEDQLFFNTKVTSVQLMVILGALNSLYMILYLLLPEVHEFSMAMKFLSENKVWTAYIAIYSLCGALGQCFVFHTLKNFGSLSLVTLTMTRKMASVLLNLFIFGHHLKPIQWLGVGILFAGISLDSLQNSSHKTSKKLQ